MTVRIALDAGHGRNTAGKRSPCGVREWTLNDAVCRQIALILADFNCVIQRTDDTTGNTDVPLATRVTRARNFNAAVLISIHHNAHLGTWGSATGTEVLVRANASQQSVRLANRIAPLLASNTGLRNRGVKTMALAVLNVPAGMRAVLCEGGFMDTRTDFSVITSAVGQRAYAQAVASALISELGIQRRPQPTPTPVPPSGTERIVYTVRSGDTLSSIARAHGTTVAAIQRINNIPDPNRISVGQRINIDRATSAPQPNFFPRAVRNASIVTMLNSIGVDSSRENRNRIARANGIIPYTATAEQNTRMVDLLANGRLIRP